MANNQLVYTFFARPYREMSLSIYDAHKEKLNISYTLHKEKLEKSRRVHFKSVWTANNCQCE